MIYLFQTEHWKNRNRIIIVYHKSIGTANLIINRIILD